MAHSGLQRSILHLYRRALRVLRTKPAHTRPKFLLTMRHAFRVHANDVSPRDVATVEVLLRRVRKKVDTWEDPSVRDCWVNEEMLQWERRWLDDDGRGAPPQGASINSSSGQ